MAEDLTIINSAAVNTGSNPVTSLSSSGAVATIASNTYEIIVRSHIAAYPWKRATKIQQLDRLDPDVHGTPPEPWTAAYQLPDDLVDVSTVRVTGSNIDYVIHGDTILCNAAEADNVILFYTWRIPETAWPAWFRMGMVLRMEAVFLRGVSHHYAEADKRDQAADAQFLHAKLRDTQGQPPRDPYVHSTLAARRA